MRDVLTRWLKAREPQAFSLLEDLVTIQSGSRNKAGIDAVAARIREELADTCLRFRLYEQEDYGDHLLAFTPAAAEADAGILLVGHTDTVFPADTDFNWYREDREHAYGPGVVDMKGGLVVGISALKALDAAGLLEQLPIRFLFNSDEEIGSPSSQPILLDLAARSRCALVLECGSLNGAVVTGRKGRLGLHLQLKGAAGHAAFASLDKKSAILELAHKVIELENLNDPERGISLNVGRMSGGIGPNTVPEEAWADIDIRYLEPAHKKELLRDLERIRAREHLPGTSSRLDLVSARGPMPQTEANRRLYRQVRALAAGLGMVLPEELRSGGSDANLVAAAGIPVLDGLGPTGALDHSDREYMVKDSLAARTRLLTLALLEV